jgi:hypothetical protein
MNNAAINRVKKVYSQYHEPSKSRLKSVSSIRFTKNLKWQVFGNQQSKNFTSVVNGKRSTGPEISSGVYGKVYEYGTDKRYVVKQMTLKTQNDLKTFLNEIRIGMIPGIERVGTRIYTFKIDRSIGQYIMDHALRGETSLVMSTLQKYIERFHPSEMSPIFKKLKTTLRNFWLITKGYHGDLHADNIAVIHKPDGTVVRVMILDYGSHKKTKVRLTRNMTFENLAQAINKNFNRSALKRPSFVGIFPNPKKFPHHKTSRTYEPVDRQKRRSNANLLKSINFQTGTTRAPVRTLMNVMMHTKKRNIRNYYPMTLISAVNQKRKTFAVPRSIQKRITNYYKPPSTPKPIK